MSLETWKQEFYPVAAEHAAVDELSAIDHSIAKWTGMRPDNLARHATTSSASNLRIVNVNDPVSDDCLIVASDSCALCVLNDRRCGDKYYGCDKCPIVEATGDGCDGGYYDYDRDEDDPTPWDTWLSTGNPEPMIQLLETTRQYFLDKLPEQEYNDEPI